MPLNTLKFKILEIIVAVNQFAKYLNLTFKFAFFCINFHIELEFEFVGVVRLASPLDRLVSVVLKIIFGFIFPQQLFLSFSYVFFFFLI